MNIIGQTAEGGNWIVELRSDEIEMLGGVVPAAMSRPAGTARFEGIPTGRFEEIPQRWSWFAQLMGRGLRAAQTARELRELAEELDKVAAQIAAIPTTTE